MAIYGPPRAGTGGGPGDLLGALSAQALWTALEYVEKVRPEFLSLRQLGRSRLFSAQLCWQVSPVLAAISGLSSGRLNRQGQLVLLQMTHFSQELWTLRIRYGSPNSSVSRGL